jgi:glycosyltransferase involved in cell wall biosynthesis
VRAHGCLTHSSDAAEAVRKSTGLIVAAIPLPLVRRADAVSSNAAPSDRVRLVTVGHINDNKRAQNVAAAISRSGELRARCEYHVVGPIEPAIRAQIEMAGRVGGNAGFITFHGRMDDEKLDSMMADAHIACCLGWPALEARSLSCIEAMARGLPTVVPNTGVYAELPNECVVKIDLAREIDHLEDALLQLVRSRERREALGAAGKAYVVRNHSAERYADDLLGLTSHVLAARPALLVLDRMGSVIADLGVDPSCTVLARVAQVIESMFGGHGPIGEMRRTRGIS